MALTSGDMRRVGRPWPLFQVWLQRAGIRIVRDIRVSLRKGLWSTRPFSFQASRGSVDLGGRLACLCVAPAGILVVMGRRKSGEDIDAWAMGRDSPFVCAFVTHGTRPDLVSDGLAAARSLHVNTVYGRAGVVLLATGGTWHLALRPGSGTPWCSKMLHRIGGLAPSQRYYFVLVCFVEQPLARGTVLCSVSMVLDEGVQLCSYNSASTRCKPNT